MSIWILTLLIREVVIIHKCIGISLNNYLLLIMRISLQVDTNHFQYSNIIVDLGAFSALLVTTGVVRKIGDFPRAGWVLNVEDRSRERDSI